MKPIFASWRIIARRVKASERKITSRSTLWTSAISHSQNGSGFVCGLSTRNTFTPVPTHIRTTLRSSSQSARQSGESQLTL